jgi:hypothetical protein
VTLPAEDVKQLRKLAADRDYQQARADEAEKQSAQWKASSENWRGLYESEKHRADDVQGGRIDLLTKANAALHDQADADKQKIGEQNFTIKKLKSERKWWFVTGAIAGGAVGGYVGYRARAGFSF